MNPDNPVLGAHMAGKQLDQVRVSFLADKGNGQIIEGTVDLAPHVTSLNGDSAEVTDCMFDHTLLRNAITGAPIGKEDTARQLVVATLQHDDTKGWVVIYMSHKATACVSSS